MIFGFLSHTDFFVIAYLEYNSCTRHFSIESAHFSGFINIQSCENTILCNFRPFALSVKGTLHPLTVTVFQHHSKQDRISMNFLILRIQCKGNHTIYSLWGFILFVIMFPRLICLVACSSASFLPWLSIFHCVYIFIYQLVVFEFFRLWQWCYK